MNILMNAKLRVTTESRNVSEAVTSGIIESEVIKSRTIEGRHINTLIEAMLIYSICSVIAIRTAYDHINERSDMWKMLIYDSLGLSSGISMLKRGTDAANKKTQVNIKEICMGDSIQYDYGNRNENVYNPPIHSNLTTTNNVREKESTKMTRRILSFALLAVLSIIKISKSDKLYDTYKGCEVSLFKCARFSTRNVACTKILRGAVSGDTIFAVWNAGSNADNDTPDKDVKSYFKLTGSTRQSYHAARRNECVNQG